MRHLIDTDWLIDHLAADPVAMGLLERLAPQGLAVSIISYMEAYQGTLRQEGAQRETAQQKIANLVNAVPVLPFSPAVARRCAQPRQDLQCAGKRIRSRAMDLLIAGTALHYGLTLVTRNTEDYDDIPALQILRP